MHVHTASPAAWFLIVTVALSMVAALTMVVNACRELLRNTTAEGHVPSSMPAASSIAKLCGESANPASNGGEFQR